LRPQYFGLKPILITLFLLSTLHGLSQVDSLLQRMIDSVKTQQQVKKAPVAKDTQLRIVPAPTKRDTQSVQVPPLKRDTPTSVSTPTPTATTIFKDSLSSRRKIKVSPVDSLRKDSIAAIQPIIIKHPIPWENDTAFMRLFTVSAINNPKPLLREGDIRAPKQKDYLFYALVGILLLLAIIKQSFPKYFSSMFSLMFQASFRQKQTRELLMQEKIPSLLMNILFIVIGGLFISIIAITNRWTDISFWELALYSITLLALLYIFKYMVIQITGWIFNVREQASTYSFIVFIINKIIGLALLPLLLLIAFSAGELWDVAVTIAGCVVVLLLLFRYIVSLTIIRSTLTIHPLHFFIYLCAVELMPMLVIYKVLFSYVGKSNF
jgi:hypothetical protein